MSTTPNSQTLLFEEIPKGTAVTNRDSIGPVPGGHGNASGWQTSIKFQKGRYGQTEGNPLGDVLPSVPACPYHMPRNTARFLDPRLNLAKKNVKDPIHASDINNLIDRIKAFQYIWEAEANNVYGYPITASPNNVSVSTTSLSYINVINGENSKPIITKDPVIVGDSTLVTIPKEEHFITISNASSVTEVINSITTQRTNKFKSHVKFNNQLPCGFPEYLDDVDVYDLTNFGMVKDSGLGNETVWNPSKIINGGHSNIVAVKPVQYIQNSKISPNFKLMYISGDKDGEIVKDKNDKEIIFLANEEYVVSYRKNNQPDTNLTYFGFGVHYMTHVINTPPGTTTVEIETITDPQKTIVKERNYAILSRWGQSYIDLNTYTDTAASMTPEIVIDVKYNLDLYCTALFNNIYYRMNENDYKTWLRGLSKYKITIPAQKMENGKYYYRKPGTSTWVESDGIYSLARFYPEKHSDVTYSNDEAMTPIDNNLQYGICLEFYVNRPFTSERYFMDSNHITTVVKNADGTRSHSELVFTNFIDFCKSKFIANTPMSTESIIFPIDNFAAIFVRISDEYSTVETWQHIKPYQLNAEQISQINEYMYLANLQHNFNALQSFKEYFTGLGCPGTATMVDGRCKITTTVDAAELGGFVSETINEVTFREADITYIKPRNLIGTGLYPVIKGTDFVNIKNVLKGYLNAVLALSQISINASGSDAQTSMDINSFMTNQANVSSIFDKDDPETTFLGYHALSKGIIKVDFYNILVDAYKLLINSCVCNADCSCNLVCVCNTNCGCNYSW